MTDKEKIKELINQVLTCDTWHNGEFIECVINWDEIIDHLVKNGVIRMDSPRREVRDMSSLYRIMMVLERKFLNETKRIDVLHTDIECDIEYMKAYLSAHQVWRIYNNMPDDNMFKDYYLGILVDRLSPLRKYYEGEVS